MSFDNRSMRNSYFSDESANSISKLESKLDTIQCDGQMKCPCMCLVIRVLLMAFSYPIFQFRMEGQMHQEFFNVIFHTTSELILLNKNRLVDLGPFHTPKLGRSELKSR